MEFAIAEGRNLEVKLNFYTLYIYEQEFGSDMIKDTIGVIRVEQGEEKEDGVIELNFKNTNWTALTKALWAACKCADDRTEPFREWAKKLDGVNMYALSESFAPLIFQELFRTGVPADLSE